MAEGRMLKKKISIDVRWADLKTDTHRLLFTVGIAHLDIEGRISGDPREFKAAVAPMLDHVTQEVVLDFFQDAERLGLIWRYRVDGRWVIQYPGFKKNQTLRPEKEGKSIYPPPPEPLPDDSGTTPGELPDNSGRTPAKEKRSKEKRSKESSVLANTTLSEVGTSDPPTLTPRGLIELFNEVWPIPSMKRPVQVTKKRLDKAKARLEHNATRGYWLEVFNKVKASPFLNGSGKPWNSGRGADFDWLTKNDDNHAKVWEGKYDKKGPEGTNAPSGGKYAAVVQRIETS
ncbi:MAG: hypothetical protein AB1491_00275 [Thermodesulfobacteriota bacterium]